MTTPQCLMERNDLGQDKHKVKVEGSHHDSHWNSREHIFSLQLRVDGELLRLFYSCSTFIALNGPRQIRRLSALRR